MAVLARGSVSDRPWGMTLGALGNRGLSGQLTLSADGKQYRVAFHQGTIVAASSPLVNDAAVRLAMTGNLVMASQVNEVTRRIAAAPDRDEVEVIAEVCRLGPEHAQRLRRRLVAQRAARTFSVERGQFVVEDRVSLPIVAGSALDVRTVIFLGARNNLADDRLAGELSQLGLWFKIKPDAIDDLPQYGFTEDDKPIVQMLLEGANVADVEVQLATLGARAVRAVAYALASCGACEASTMPQMSRTLTPSGSTTSPGGPSPTSSPEPGARPSVPKHHARTSTIPPPVRGAAGGRPPSTPPPQAGRTVTGGNHAAYATTPPPGSRTTTSSGAHPSLPRAPTPGNHAAYATTPSGSRTTTNSGASPSLPRAPTNSGASLSVSRTPTPGDHATYATPPSGSRTTTNSGNPAVARTRTEPPTIARTSTPGLQEPGSRASSSNPGRPGSRASSSNPGQPASRASSSNLGQPPSPRAQTANAGQPSSSRTSSSNLTSPAIARTPSPNLPSTARTQSSNLTPSARTSTADLTPPTPGRTPPPQYGRTPSTPPVPTGRTSTQHKTAPLGSRSPLVPPAAPASGDSPQWSGADDEWANTGDSYAPTTSRTSTGSRDLVTPRTITESSGVPRASTHSGSGPGGHDRSSSSRITGGYDRSPSAGVSRPRSGSASVPPTNMTSLRASPRGANVPRRPKQNTAATLEIESLLQKKIPMLDRGVDYFTLLGLPVGASPEDVRQTYFMLARKLHPDRLAAIGIDDNQRHAQRLMACINEAFAVLNDPIRREEYISILDRGGEEAVRAEEQKADELAMRVMRAEEAFRQGEMALRREQLEPAIQHFSTAVELAPNEPEYRALLAWAKFAASSDKQGIAIETRKALIRAAEQNEESPTARFYLGRVERMLGREKEALVYFHEVLRIKPSHAEASSEARILEKRLNKKR